MLDNERARVMLRDIHIDPVPGGIRLSCDVHVDVHTAVTDAVGLTPNATAAVTIPFSPIIVHKGRPSVHMSKPEIRLTDEHNAVVRSTFAFLKDRMYLEENIQRAMNNMADTRLNGRSLIDLAIEHAETESKERGIHTLLRYVDVYSAEGAVVMTARGDIVLQLNVQPTPHAKRMAVVVLVLGVLLLVGIIVGLVFALK